LLILKFIDAEEKKMVDPNSNTMNDWNAFAEEMSNAVTGLPILTGQQAKTRWNGKGRYI